MTFTYDLAGRMLTSADPDHYYGFNYDALDRLGTQNFTITGLDPSVNFESQFDASGNRRWLESNFDYYPYDSLTTYEYDGLNRLTRISQEGLDLASAPKRVDFTYDLVGQLEFLTRYAETNGGNAIASTDYTWDKAGRLQTLTHFAGNDPGYGLLAGYDFAWNQRGHLRAIDFLPDGTNSPFDYTDEDVDYSYDARGQLTGADYGYGGPVTDEAYGYDANGNRELVANTHGANQDYDTGGDNRLTDDDTYTYAYDNEGNRTQRTHKTTYDRTAYEWDHRNRLVGVKKYAGHNTATTADDTLIEQVWNYYDAENQWIRRVVDPDGATGLSALKQTVFIHDNGQIVLQFDKTGSGALAVDDLSHRYLWADVVDELLADERVNDIWDAGANELLWALTDHKGTVHDLIDNSATVVNHLVYDTAGNVLSQTNAAYEPLFKYNGKPYDATVGGYWMQMRWYDPVTGRWLSRSAILVYFCPCLVKRSQALRGRNLTRDNQARAGE